MPEPHSQNWLLQWGTLALAFVALIQPWLRSAFRKLFRKPKIQIFEAGTIEIGYSAFGPTVGLNGTIRVGNKDVFVSAIELEVVRLRDKSTHYFDWAYFRSNKVRLSQLSDMEFELASGFVLSTVQPHRYNTVFVESEAQKELFNLLQPFAKEWNEYFLKRSSEDSQKSPNVSPSDQVRLAAYESFAGTKVHADTLAKVDRSRYWDPGEYAITMTVETASPNFGFSESWNFSIDEGNATLLSSNSLEILRTVCGSGNGKWNVAYCQYDYGAPPAHNSQKEDAHHDI